MNVRLLFLAAPLAFAPLAEAQSDSSPLAPLFACRDIQNDAERLACLDREVDTLRGETEAGEIVAVDRQQIDAAEEATYGLQIPGFSLPDVPRLSLPTLRSESEDLADAEAASPATQRTVIRDDEGRIERIENLAVASIGETAYGRLVIELQNGQTWTQIDDTRVVLPRSIPEDEMTASIRNASLGSHLMQLNGRGRWFRARRDQ